VFALKAKNIAFSDDLKYIHENCKESCNNAELEPNLKKMSFENYVKFKQFKEIT
jgi:hypothetical protein